MSAPLRNCPFQRASVFTDSSRAHDANKASAYFSQLGLASDMTPSSCVN